MVSNVVHIVPTRRRIHWCRLTVNSEIRKPVVLLLLLCYRFIEGHKSSLRAAKVEAFVNRPTIVLASNKTKQAKNY